MCSNIHYKLYSLDQGVKGWAPDMASLFSLPFLNITVRIKLC